MLSCFLHESLPGKPLHASESRIHESRPSICEIFVHLQRRAARALPRRGRLASGGGLRRLLPLPGSASSAGSDRQSACNVDQSVPLVTAESELSCPRTCRV